MMAGFQVDSGATADANSAFDAKMACFDRPDDRSYAEKWVTE